MARRLASRFSLSVWNRTRQRALSFRGPCPEVASSFRGPCPETVRIASTAKECARGADVVVTVVSDGRALEQVLSGNDGALAGIEPGAVLVDMSTTGRAAAREAARAVEAAGARFVDAPVSGSVGPAERGELVAMVGGADADVARVEPVLRAMCSRLLRAGGVGQGQALKVVLNGMGSHHFVAFASMLALGERAGLPREVVVEAFTTGAFASPSYVGKRAKMIARDYTPEFSLSLALKDGALNVALQEEVGMVLPVQREIAREMDRAVRDGLGEEDLFAIEKYFARRPIKE